MSTPIAASLLLPLEEQMSLRQCADFKQQVEDLMALGWTQSVAEELAGWNVAHQCAAQTTRVVQ